MDESMLTLFFNHLIISKSFFKALDLDYLTNFKYYGKSRIFRGKIQKNKKKIYLKNIY
jgi:hypothetical protein